MTDIYRPLVSIIVITYNSAEFLIECLDSVKNQSYSNIELIISDDCSSDSTLSLSQKWLALNNSRFVSARIIASKTNQGTSININNGFRAAKGEWIKSVAGDDLLLQNCIQDNITFVLKNNLIKVLQSKTHIIDANSKVIGSALELDSYFISRNASAADQHRLLLRKYISNTTTIFINRDVIEKHGYHDESIILMEDYPLWLTLTKSGHKIYFLDRYTTKYRTNLNSVSYDEGDTKIINSIYLYNVLTSQKYVLPELNGIELLIERYRLFIITAIMHSIFNRKNIINNFIWRVLYYPVKLSKKHELGKIYKEIDSL